jgi:uncharacterized protein HemX
MKYKNWNIFVLLARVSVILSSFLLSVGLAIAQSAPPPTSGLSNQERQEIDRSQGRLDSQAQVMAEANRAFSQTTMLLNLMLVTLALILGAAIAAFLLLRRAVIREVAELVRTHLKEL